MAELEKVVLVSKKDVVISWFAGGGAGGQYRNKHQNCCRIYHPESGATGVGTKQRSAEQNKRDAFAALTKTGAFQMWLARKLVEIRTGETIEQRVEKQMHPKNILVEKLQNGQWVEFETDEVYSPSC